MLAILLKVFIGLGLVVGSIIMLSVIAFIISCGVEAAKEAGEESIE